MSWIINEIVRAGNSTARVKNYYANTDLLVLYDIRGSFGSGTTVVGDTSGTTKTFTTFTISREYDLGYEPIDYWNAILSIPENYLVTDNNESIVIDEYFNTTIPNLANFLVVSE